MYLKINYECNIIFILLILLYYWWELIFVETDNINYFSVSLECIIELQNIYPFYSKHVKCHVLSKRFIKRCSSWYKEQVVSFSSIPDQLYLNVIKNKKIGVNLPHEDCLSSIANKGVLPTKKITIIILSDQSVVCVCQED